MCSSDLLNPNPNPNQKKPSLPVTVGFSVAVNDLKASTAAELADSNLSYGSGSSPVVDLQAQTRDLKLSTVSIAAAGSGTGGSAQSGLGSYAVAGSGAGAQNTYTNPVSATVSNSTVQPVSGASQRDVKLNAAADEQLLSVTGGLDVAMALALQEEGPSGALSVAASASYNALSGAITAQIAADTSVIANDLNLSATDNSQIGAYAIAGALTASSSALSKSFGGAFVGAGTGNSIDRPLGEIGRAHV